MLLSTCVLLLLATTGYSDEIGAYNPEWGVFIGDLPNMDNGDISGKVYVINETSLQILNFTYNGNAPDLYFWLDHKETPTVDGVKVPSFEYGITPIGPYENAERVVLTLPGLHKINNFRSFSLFCFKYENNFGSIVIPETLVVPKPQFIASELKGNRYNVGSGPVLVQDKRTIKVFAFTFDADKAPDGYFFVGRGPNVAHDAGVKVAIRGRDKPGQVTAMNERYRGGQDIILELPEDYDIEHIDWLAVYCYKFRVDFGHIAISNVSTKIPPFVPPQKRFDDLYGSVDGWKPASLLGTPERTNFTFQLGTPAGKKGYQFMARARPAKNVWYVNGLMADIYLKRGVAYNFIVEGGNDKAADFFNPLYLTDDQFGGYGKLSNDEREHVKVIYPRDASSTAGRMCSWTAKDEVDPDTYKSFADFRKTLRLSCEKDKQPATFQFTPDATTPNTIYYQSYSAYNMGWKIYIVDEFPANVTNVKEEPYIYEEWLATQKAQELTAGTMSMLSFLTFSLVAILLL